MSDQAVLLPKWFSHGPGGSHGGIILAKEQLDHSYTYWIMPIMIFSRVYFFLVHPLLLAWLKAVHEDICFFSLFRKYNGKNETVVSHLVSQPLSVEANHIALQPQANNPCEKTKCDQLCLLAPKVSSPVGFTCKCRPGFRKGDDGQCIEKVNLYFSQRYTYRVLQTIQMKLILLCVWAEPAVLGSAKTALKFKYEI